MKKLLTLFALMFFVVTAKAQIYDGITQPTKYRVWIPITASFDGGNSVSPFVGYKYEPIKWFSATPILQYNLNTKHLSPQLWLNFNIKQRYYLLSRSIYDCRTNRYRHTLSTTVKLPEGFMIDATWNDLYNGIQFANTDHLQLVAGYAYKFMVCNIGYSMRNTPGLIANIRFKITEYNWLQLKYDGGLNALSTNIALQFN